MTVPASPPSAASISHTRLIFVRHAMPGAFIELVAVRPGEPDGGEPRSLVLSEKRVMGLIQQLAPFAEGTRRFSIYDHDGSVLGDIGGDHVWSVIADLARAVHANRLHDRRRRNGR